MVSYFLFGPMIMILKNEIIDLHLHPNILRKLCCPVCLSDLFYSFVDRRKSHLICKSCGSNFLVYEQLPIFLIDDANWRKKADEIEGEISFNTEIIPPEVHEERNAFVDMNTDFFLKQAEVNLSNKDILIVGCSAAELSFFSQKSENIVPLDIVPSLIQCYSKPAQERRMPPRWVCGDGECLPLENESFDFVIVRQTLHHMLKYYSAISEFFRVCKKGGNVLIIDEPFSPPDFNDSLLSSLPDDFIVYEGVNLGQIRKELNISSTSRTETPDMHNLEANRPYINPTQRNPESLLSDKYHSFSLLNCVIAIRIYSNDYQLIWPLKIAWTEESDNVIRFCSGPNPHYDEALLKKLVIPGNVSLSASKNGKASVFRDRKGVRAIPLDLAYKLAGVDDNKFKEIEGNSISLKKQVEDLTRLVRGSEANQIAQMKQIEELTSLVRESEAKLSAQLQLINELNGKLAKLSASYLFKIFRKVMGIK